MKFIEIKFNAFIAFSVIVVFLMIMIIPKSEAALTVTDITTTEFNSLISTHDAAWSVLYRGGSTDSGTNVEEIRIARNTATPQAGGGTDTLIGNLTWSRPTEIEILIDGAGNISARAGSTTVSDQGFAVTRPSNQILIRAFESSSFGASDLQDIDLNGFIVRNMFADGTPGTPANDVISIHNFGSQSPFDFIANWDPGSVPNSNDQYVWIVALQNPAIPEPSTLFLTSITSLLLLRRKR